MGRNKKIDFSKGNEAIRLVVEEEGLTIVVPKNLEPELRQIFLNMHTDRESQEMQKRLMIDRFVVTAETSCNRVREMKRIVESSRLG